MGKGAMEREINLVDMIWAVCLKWRSILACAVILAVLAGGFSYYRSVKSISALEEAEKVTSEDLIEDLTYEEMKTSEVYLNYKKTYEELTYYNENAPLMKIDANNFYVGEVSYFFDNGYKLEYPVIAENNNIVAIVSAYKGMIGTQEFAQQVQQLLGDTNNASYAMELVDCDGEYAGTNIIPTQEERGVLSIAVYAADEETCVRLKELVKEVIETSKSTVLKQFGSHEVTVIKDIVNKSSSGELLNKQKEKMDFAYTCSNNMYNMSLKFTPAQQSYLNKCIEEMDGMAEDVKEEEKELPTASVSKKMIVLGFLGGAFLMFVIWALIYIFSNRIRLEDNFETIFGSKLLGNVPISEKEKKWFRFIDSIFEKLRHFNQRYFDRDEALDMIAANVRIAMAKKDVKKVMLTGAAFGAEEKEIAEDLAERLKKDGIEILGVSSILYNAESLEKLVEIGQVVLVEKAEQSLYGEVEREIEICRQQEVNLIGCVVAY
jgi:RNA-binding protein YhbY